MKSCITALSIAGLLVGSAVARTWTSADGANTIEADFKSFNSATGKVSVSQANGSLKIFSLSFLSAADQAWVKEQAAESDLQSSQASSVDVTKQAVGKNLTSRILRRLKGKRFKRAKLEKSPEYYILYFSASW